MMSLVCFRFGRHYAKSHRDVVVILPIEREMLMASLLVELPPPFLSIGPFVKY